MSERAFTFYRCPDGTVAYDAVICDNAVYRLDEVGICPLCQTPVAEHEVFTLRATSPETRWDEAA
jgi:hypothetical protein